MRIAVFCDEGGSVTVEGGGNGETWNLTQGSYVEFSYDGPGNPELDEDEYKLPD